MPDRSKSDVNRVRALIVVDSQGNETIVELYADSATHRLLTNTTVTGTVTTTGSADLGTTSITGQTTISVTNTAVQLPSNVIKNGVIVRALSANGSTVVIGPASVTTATGFQLEPGESTSTAVTNTNALYVNGTSGDGVCFISSS